MPPEPDAAFHKRMAAEFFNETWTLLEKPHRTIEEDALMIHLAHASRAHWQYAGVAENFAIGEWQVSRVHAVLGQSEPALYHGRRALDIAQENALGPFHIACGHEAIARALASNHPETALEHIAAARALAAQLTDPEEKQTIENDLASVPVGQNPPKSATA